jgi:hypothetical protein
MLEGKKKLVLVVAGIVAVGWGLAAAFRAMERAEAEKQAEAGRVRVERAQEVKRMIERSMEDRDRNLEVPR